MRNEIQILMGGFDDGRTPSVQQYDVNSREYLCRLWERPGIPFLMAEDAIVGAVFDWRASPPSKEYKAEAVDRSTVLVTVPAEAMKKVGPVNMQILIHQNGGVLHSPEISFMVLKSLKASDKATDGPVLLLVALVDEVRQALAEADAAASRSPYIGENGNWWIWNGERKVYVDSMNPSCGTDGRSFTVLGLYGTLSELIQAHPAGSEGHAYAVGTSASNEIYIWDVDAGQWANVGVLQGPKGETPRRGTDYWTEADIAEIKSYVDEAILGGAW